MSSMLNLQNERFKADRCSGRMISVKERNYIGLNYVANLATGFFFKKMMMSNGIGRAKHSRKNSHPPISYFWLYWHDEKLYFKVNSVK